MTDLLTKGLNAPARSTPKHAAKVQPEGIVEAIVAVTGVVDEVDDLLVPGCFSHTLSVRRPKVVESHAWSNNVGRVLHIEEWLPGDPRLPKRTKDGKKWPEDAGALVATMQYNLRSDRGREAFEMVRFYAESNEAEYSIGYKVPDGKGRRRRDGVRVVLMVDLFELSHVLFGAAPLSMALNVKDARGGGGITVTGDHDIAALHAAAAEEIDWDEVAAARAHSPNTAWDERESKAADGDDSSSDTDELVAAGLAVKATDTGRVLMLQRALDDEDPASGTWEFPGGHIDDGEDPLQSAFREWGEETGADLPHGQVVESWDSPNGVYRGFVYVVPSEESVKINADHEDRGVLNPDDPDGDNIEVAAWWNIATLPKMPALRKECCDTPWEKLALAAAEKQPRRATVESKSASQVLTEAKSLHDDAPAGAHFLTKAGGWDRNKGNAENLRRWYVAGGGGVIGWGSEGDFMRCVGIASEHMSAEDAKGYCNLRHKEALGFYPAEHKAHAADQEEKAMSYMQGSYEDRRNRIEDATRDLFVGLRGLDSGDNDAAGSLGVCCQATFDTEAIVTVYQDGDDKTFLVTYSMDDNGQVELGEPREVSLSVVAHPEGDEEPQEDSQVGDDLPEGAYDEIVERMLRHRVEETKALIRAAAPESADALLAGLEGKAADGDDQDPDDEPEESEGADEGEGDTSEKSADDAEPDDEEVDEEAEEETPADDTAAEGESEEELAEAEEDPYAGMRADEQAPAGEDPWAGLRDEPPAEPAPEAGQAPPTEEPVTIDPDEHFALMDDLEAATPADGEEANTDDEDEPSVA